MNWQPLTDMKTTEKEVIIVIELPGVPRDSFSLRVEENLLILEGTKPAESIEGENFVYKEIESGKFKTMFQTCKNVDLDNIQAELKNGVLTISVPWIEKEVKNIDISEG